MTHSGYRCFYLFAVFCSTDKITTGPYIISPGSFYEPPGLHLFGDECYYMKEGKGVAVNPENGETFSFKEGEALLIPQKTRHQLFNFENKRLTVIFTVAPRIWVEGEIGVTMTTQPVRTKLWRMEFTQQLMNHPT